MNHESVIELEMVNYNTSVLPLQDDIEINNQSECSTSKIGDSNTNLSKSKKFNCNLCDASLYSEKFLMRHMITRHPKTPKILICDFDGKQFRNKDNLKFHMERHRSTELLTCEICQKSYISKMTFKRHLKTVSLYQKYINQTLINNMTFVAHRKI
jgi:transcription elongation factor Elf1